MYIYIYRGVWDMIGISKSAQSLLRRMFSSASAGRSKKQLLFVSRCGGWLLGRAANIKIWEMRFWEIELSNLQCISPKISIIYKHRSSFSLPFDNLTRYRFVLSRFWLRISQFIPIRFISSIFRARKCGRGINSTCKNKLHDGKKMILGIIGIKRAREKERRWKRSRAVYR